ncbi:MAG: hypothetical protein QNK92_07610 [Amylibacter sp.]
MNSHESRISIKSINNSFSIGGVLCFWLFSSPLPVVAGNIPEEVTKTPFEPSKSLKGLKLDLKNCLAEVGGLNYDLEFERKTEKDT